ncbi:indolepyruvate oxidoreductase subunit beta [Candidatus Poribacteria bacterium]|nr:indolepyruvate oxidoreductase subunit beta [Candidatus Poribacteria bacterium]
MKQNGDCLNVIITGVGGQGNILASHILATAAIAEGFHVTIGETYGQSQRGGSVMSHVRLSKGESLGALIPRGKAHVIVGLEPMETLRVAADYANPGTKTIVNPRPNYPLMVLYGAQEYPPVETLLARLGEMVEVVKVVEGTELAKGIGEAMASNVVMVGALAGSGWTPIPTDTFISVLKEVIPQKILALNQRALKLGIESIRK